MAVDDYAAEESKLGRELARLQADVVRLENNKSKAEDALELVRAMVARGNGAETAVTKAKDLVAKADEKLANAQAAVRVVIEELEKAREDARKKRLTMLRQRIANAKLAVEAKCAELQPLFDGYDKAYADLRECWALAINTVIEVAREYDDRLLEEQIAESARTTVGGLYMRDPDIAMRLWRKARSRAPGYVPEIESLWGAMIWGCEEPVFVEGRGIVQPVPGTTGVRVGGEG
jgi:hypothetical protein